LQFDVSRPRAASTASVGLGVENVSRFGGAVPVPPAAGRPGRAGAHTARHIALIFRFLATEDLADLEQGGVAEAAGGVARGRLQQVGQDRGPHGVEIGGDGIGQLHRRLVA
jgi:hypothetical protein